MSDQASAVHGSDRGFAKLDLEMNDLPGLLKTSLFGIQHVLVMFTAMVGGPLEPVRWKFWPTRPSRTAGRVA